MDRVEISQSNAMQSKSRSRVYISGCQKFTANLVRSQGFRLHLSRCPSRKTCVCRQDVKSDPLKLRSQRPFTADFVTCTVTSLMHDHPSNHHHHEWKEWSGFMIWSSSSFEIVWEWTPVMQQLSSWLYSSENAWRSDFWETFWWLFACFGMFLDDF